jgi:hypothetical protein
MKISFGMGIAGALVENEAKYLKYKPRSLVIDYWHA